MNQTHNPKVESSNPSPATNSSAWNPHSVKGMRTVSASLLFVSLVAVLALAAGAFAASGPVVVSANHRFLQYQDGAPFFWLGDTAWLLFARLDRTETERYLENRRAKGFTVIQVMVLHGADMTNSSGVPALVNSNPGTPNVTPGSDPARPGEYDFWDHVDWVVDRAAEKGLFVAMVPAWGSIARQGQLNMGNVLAYTTFLARRYRSKPNVFWLVGGDTRGDQQNDVWNAMGRTLRAEDPGHLATFHPFGRMQSSTWFHEQPWLDFNMFQSGHRRYDQDTDSPRRYGEDNWRFVQEDLARTPPKPVLDGEPSYENIPQGLHDTKEPYWKDADARRYAYWSVFAGACGHTYGDSAIMQFHKPGVGAGSYGPLNYWTEAIDDPGAGQMQYLKRLILSRPYLERVADPAALAGASGARYDYVAITRGASYLFAYAYSGRPFEIRMGAIGGSRARAIWYSPRDGSTRVIGTFATGGTRKFTPPGEPRPGNDWVLVLDDAAKRYPMP
jgi:hypothetical protein